MHLLDPRPRILHLGFNFSEIVSSEVYRAPESPDDILLVRGMVMGRIEIFVLVCKFGNVTLAIIRLTHQHYVLIKILYAHFNPLQDDTRKAT